METVTKHIKRLTGLERLSDVERGAYVIMQAGMIDRVAGYYDIPETQYVVLRVGCGDVEHSDGKVLLVRPTQSPLKPFNAMFESCDEHELDTRGPLVQGRTALLPEIYVAESELDALKFTNQKNEDNERAREEIVRRRYPDERDVRAAFAKHDIAISITRGKAADELSPIASNVYRIAFVETAPDNAIVVARQALFTVSFLPRLPRTFFVSGNAGKTPAALAGAVHELLKLDKEDTAALIAAMQTKEREEREAALTAELESHVKHAAKQKSDIEKRLAESKQSTSDDDALVLDEAIGWYEELRMLNEHTILAQTPDVYIRGEAAMYDDDEDDTEYNVVEYPLGRYTVLIDTEKRRINLVSAREWGRRVGYEHPHVEQSGAVCDGNTGLRLAVREKRYADALILVRSVLENYNAGSPYLALHNFAEEDGEELENYTV